MPRMHPYESTVSRSSTGKTSRYTTKQTAQRVASVASMLDRSTLIKKQCYTCEAVIECDTRPIVHPAGFGVIVPKFTAPLICRVCRMDKTKFYIARKAMLNMFGWVDTHIGHGWEG